MPKTIDNVTVAMEDGWVDAYALVSAAKGSAVAVGTALEINLLSGGEIFICIRATKPEDDKAYKTVRGYGGALIDAGEPGVWIKAPYTAMLLNIEDVV